MMLIDADALRNYFLKRPTEEFLYDRRFTAKEIVDIIDGQLMDSDDIEIITAGLQGLQKLCTDIGSCKECPAENLCAEIYRVIANPSYWCFDEF